MILLGGLSFFGAGSVYLCGRLGNVMRGWCLSALGQAAEFAGMSAIWPKMSIAPAVLVGG